MGGLFVFSLLLLVFSSARPGMISDVRMQISDTFTPVVSAVTQPFQDAVLFVRGVSGLAEMQTENQRLIEENMRLREWHKAAMSLQAENKSLRDLLNVKSEQVQDFTTARVIADSGSPFARTLLITAGRRDGVQPARAVLSSEGVIGRVVESGEKGARVLLINDINSRVPVLIEQKNLHAIMAGDNSARPYIDHLPEDAEVRAGMHVVTSGYGGVFPYGLPVGVIVKTPQGRYKIEPYADLSRVLFVRVAGQAMTPDFVPAGKE